MRLKFFILSLIISFLLVLTGLFYTQVIMGEYYQKLAEKNRIIVIPLKAPRGKVYDRSKDPLVDNRISFNLSIIYEQAKDVELLSGVISKNLNVDKKEIMSKIRNARFRRFTPTLLAEDIGKENAIVFEQWKIYYPGLIITTEPKRDYLLGEVGGHILGYLGKINEEELTRYKTYGYRTTDLVGRDGLEKEYDTYLRGADGGMQVEVDAAGRQRGVLGIREPISGKNLYTTIDKKLEKFCDEAMGKRNGSIIVMDPKTGAIRAFISKPGFDPSVFIKAGEKNEALDILENKKENYPLLNRGISCAYPPGSVFKIVVAAASLETGKFSKSDTFNCNGVFNLSKNTFRCWNESGHGVQGLKEAIKNSCNVFFYQLGLRAGVDEIYNFAKKFGLGEKTGVDLPGEATGVVPNPQWKRIRFKENWFPGDTVNYSIGQGYLLTTPMQILRTMSIFANGGYLVKPYVVDEIDDIKISNPDLKKVDISLDTIDIIRDGLYKVVNDPDGTASRACMRDIKIAGKTGTAQNPKGEAHGWFCGFAPFEDPKISIVVFVEFGGKGGVEASLIARKVLEKTKELGLL